MIFFTVYLQIYLKKSKAADFIGKTAAFDYKFLLCFDNTFYKLYAFA